MQQKGDEEYSLIGADRSVSGRVSPLHVHKSRLWEHNDLFLLTGQRCGVGHKANQRKWLLESWNGYTMALFSSILHFIVSMVPYGDKWLKDKFTLLQLGLLLYLFSYFHLVIKTLYLASKLLKLGNAVTLLKIIQVRKDTCTLRWLYNL